METPLSPETAIAELFAAEPNRVEVEEHEEIVEGRSGAKVWSLQIHDSTPRAGNAKTLDGLRILKATHSKFGGGGDEARNLDMLKTLNPGFLKKYAIRSETPQFRDGWTYLLTEHVNEIGGYRTTTLDGKHDESVASIVGAVAAALLPRASGGESLNPASLLERVGPQYSPSQLVGKWIEKRLNPASEGFARVLEAKQLFGKPGSTAYEIRIANQHFLDPMWACLACPQFDEAKITIFRGYLHGDLHPGNIMCATHPVERRKGEFRLIDWALFKSSPLLYDHAYLKVALFSKSGLSKFFPMDGEEFDKIALWVLGEGVDHENPGGEVELTHNALIAVDQAIRDWHEQQKQDGYTADIEPQAILANLAAGINWAGFRDLQPDERKLAYLYSAVALRKYDEWLNRKHEEKLQGKNSISRKKLTPSAEVPKIKGRGQFLSGQSIINALLFTNSTWYSLQEILGSSFSKLCNGDELDEAGSDRLYGLIESHQLFEKPSSKKLRDYLAIEDVEVNSLEKRLTILGKSGSHANRCLRELLRNRITFQCRRWLQSVQHDLEEVRAQEIIYKGESNNATRSFSDRTWRLRKAYYHSGIRLTMDEMADAAIADFSDKRWLPLLSGDPRETAHGHLRVSNERIGEILCRRLPESDEEPISIVEGGVGGGHTAYFVLEALTNADRHRSGIRYAGIELVPSLAGSIDEQMKRPMESEESNELYKKLRSRNSSGLPYLRPLLNNRPFVDHGRMEHLISDFSDELVAQNHELDAVVISYAFHHVPNGQAIIRYVANDAPEFAERLDQEDEVERKAISAGIAEGCVRLHRAFSESLGKDCPRVEFEARRREILNDYDATADQPQASINVFLSLFDPGAVNEQEISLFADTITERYWYPRERVERMLRNPQREVLLTAQSMLKDGGVLIIADPDGTSDFNAEMAAEDPELTVANFLAIEELISLLEGMGFEAIESYDVFPAAARDSGQVNVIRREANEDSRIRQERPALGYIVGAERQKRRERELSESAMSRNAGLSAGRFLGVEDEKIGRLGQLLSESDDSTRRVVDELLSPPDPWVGPSTLFRKIPELRQLLVDAQWIENLAGSTVIARKRIHRIDNPTDPASRPVVVATDFPPTPREIREGVSRVFSYSDEAIVMAQALKNRLSTYADRECRILDCCAGAGTLGVLAGVMHQSAEVVFSEINTRSVRQIEQNIQLNRLDPERFKVEKVDLWPLKNGGKFDLILADPPFLLRPEASVNNWETPDSGGSEGDKVSGRIIQEAHEHLASDGTLLLLGYTLLKAADSGAKIETYLRNSELRGEFKSVPGWIWRFRHDKIADNHARIGAPLWIMLLRLGDTTRPEAINFDSCQEGREQAAIHISWIRELMKNYDGIQFVLGELQPIGE